MSKLYNNNNTIVKRFSNFFKKFTKSKTLLNFVPGMFYSMIQAQSVNYVKIATEYFKELNSSIYLNSIHKRIYRTLHNPHYTFHKLFDDIVNEVLSKYKLSHEDRNIHISFDHSYDKDHFTILMFTVRIGKQGIPIYFEVFLGKQDEESGEAFKMINLKKGFLYCHNLIKKYIPDANIIFLADRWFGNLFPLMQYIDSLGDIFVFRCKSNLKVFYQKYPENHKVWNLPEKNIYLI